MAGLIVAIGLFWVVAAWFAASTAERALKLPDGREITLLQTTYGTQHRCALGKPLRKAVGPFLPADWRTRLGVRTVTYTSATPTLMFWVLLRDYRGTNQGLSTAAVFNEQGNESEPAWLSISSYSPSGGTVAGWAFANYPRSARRIGFKLFQYHAGVSQPGVVAQFDVRNPGPRPTADWTAPSLPVTQRDEGLACTLFSLTAGKPAPSRFDGFAPYHANWNTALFQIAEGGAPTLAWTVAGLKAVESTGNVCDIRATTCRAVGPYLVVEFDGALWQGEQAWKLNVELSRAADFAADELWSIKSVPVPATIVTPARTNLQTTVQGLDLVGLQLARDASAGPFMPGAFRRTATVNLETARAVAGTRVTLVQAIDDRGQTVPHQPGHSSSNTVDSFGLAVGPGVTNLDFTFAIHKSRFLEFLAKPTVRTNSAPAPKP